VSGSGRDGQLPDVGVLIPAYRAGSTVGEVARAALDHARLVVVVDDGSSDNTFERAREAGALTLRHPRNLGKGAALATGFAELLRLGTEAVVTLDADGQHDPREIPMFAAAWRETAADVIVGARIEGFGSMSGGRRFGNRFSSAAVRFFRGPALPDTQCGYRLYSERFLRSIRFRRRAYDAEVELLMRAAAGGYRVMPLPIRVLAPDGRPTSHYRPWLDTYRMCRTVVFCGLVESRPARLAEE
jgi:glycosyltransferase involved in cell wall biosynthesis